VPLEHFISLDDSGIAPYGERGDAYVAERSRVVTQRLRSRLGIKALVIACNTATKAAVALLRAEHPDLPIIDVAPGLKSAAAASHTKRVGVIGTHGTITSAKFDDHHGRPPAALQDAARRWLGSATEPAFEVSPNQALLVAP
jgi:glutamate racemase